MFDKVILKSGRTLMFVLNCYSTQKTFKKAMQCNIFLNAKRPEKYVI